jgi:hypothetical protein
LPALQRAQTSELHGIILVKLFKPKPCSCHRVAHRTAHRWEPCEIGGVVEILGSQNVSDDDVVEKAGDDLARVRIAALTLLLSRASFLTGHRVETQTWMVSCARRVRVVVRRGFREGGLKGPTLGCPKLTKKRK